MSGGPPRPVGWMLPPTEDVRQAGGQGSGLTFHVLALLSVVLLWYTCPHPEAPPPEGTVCSERSGGVVFAL